MDLARLRGAQLPAQLLLDNGPELVSRALEQWAHGRDMTLHFIDPGQRIENAHRERFHGRVRDECLDELWLLGLADARHIVEVWRHDYNRVRPHSALGYQAPAEYAQQAVTAAPPLPADDGLSYRGTGHSPRHHMRAHVCGQAWQGMAGPLRSVPVKLVHLLRVE